MAQVEVWVVRADYWKSNRLYTPKFRFWSVNAWRPAVLSRRADRLLERPRYCLDLCLRAGWPVRFWEEPIYRTIGVLAGHAGHARFAGACEADEDVRPPGVHAPRRGIYSTSRQVLVFSVGSFRDRYVIPAIVDGCGSHRLASCFGTPGDFQVLTGSRGMSNGSVGDGGTGCPPRRRRSAACERNDYRRRMRCRITTTGLRPWLSNGRPLRGLRIADSLDWRPFCVFCYCAFCDFCG